jgi:hypothetical protein
MEMRYFENKFEHLFSLSGVDSLLKEALEDIVVNYAPRSEYSADELTGLFAGPTGIAYLFLHVSAKYPELRIKDRTANEWAAEYLKGSRGDLELRHGMCGLGDEMLAFQAVNAALTKDLSYVEDFVSSITEIISGDFPDELLYGRAGTIYMLRLIRHWVPDSRSKVESAIDALSKKILSNGPDWEFFGSRYIDTVHGDIGIITQLVLTTPTLAPDLESLVAKLLNMQLPDGNWPVFPEEHLDRPDKGLVQFCHGAPGFITSLESLRAYYPSLHEKIDLAIGKGREVTWTRGLLRKEPSLCHGILSNAL